MQLSKMKNLKLPNAMLIGLIASIACLVCNVPFYSSSFAQQQKIATQTSRIIYLFNSHIPDANETKLGIPTDLFAPSSITVNKGDTVIVHFYNTENEPHTFTIGAPYNIDKNVLAGQNATIVFKANYQGIFQYYCKYHLPTMQGQLIVQA
jgi:plastocyanin